MFLNTYFFYVVHSLYYVNICNFFTKIFAYFIWSYQENLAAVAQESQFLLDAAKWSENLLHTSHQWHKLDATKCLCPNIIPPKLQFSPAGKIKHPVALQSPVLLEQTCSTYRFQWFTVPAILGTLCAISITRFTLTSPYLVFYHFLHKNKYLSCTKEKPLSRWKKYRRLFYFSSVSMLFVMKLEWTIGELKLCICDMDWFFIIRSPSHHNSFFFWTHMNQVLAVWCTFTTTNYFPCK